jgi:two-component system, NarL family, nitrate/nitrite response regulator NarL
MKSMGLEKAIGEHSANVDMLDRRRDTHLPRPFQGIPRPGVVGSALIVEDHPLYRDALVHLLSEMLGDSQVVATTSVEKGARLAEEITDLRLVLLDIGLPGLSGTEAVSAIRRAYPAATLVVVSASDDRREVRAVLSAGAQFFISKTIGTDTLATILGHILAGERPEQTVWMESCGESIFLDDFSIELSPRQRQALGLLSNGCTNKEIGLRLGLAEVTVKMHISSIFRVLGVTNRTQAVLAARRLGLFEPGNSD